VTRLELAAVPPIARGYEVQNPQVQHAYQNKACGEEMGKIVTLDMRNNRPFC
jgi:hypothetical protein